MKRLVTIALMCAVFLTTSGMGWFWKSKTVKITWNPSKWAEGYKVYYGPKSRAYNVPIDVGDKTTWTGKVAASGSGAIHYFAVTAYNKYGESPFSEEVNDY